MDPMLEVAAGEGARRQPGAVRWIFAFSNGGGAFSNYRGVSKGGGRSQGHGWVKNGCGLSKQESAWRVWVSQGHGWVKNGCGWGVLWACFDREGRLKGVERRRMVWAGEEKTASDEEVPKMLAVWTLVHSKRRPNGVKRLLLLCAVRVSLESRMLSQRFDRAGPHQPSTPSPEPKAGVIREWTRRRKLPASPNITPGRGGSPGFWLRPGCRGRRSG